MDLTRLRGIFPPIVTPLTPDERVDAASLRRVIDFVIEGGVHGIWVMGTTGEFAGLPEDERARGVQVTVEHVAGRVPVVANVGDGSTQLAIRNARHAAEAGVDAIAMTPPYYYPHSMDEMLDHFRTMKRALPDLPLLIYNIPQTVKVQMTVATTLQLAREGTVQGIKDSQNDLQWFRNMVLGIRDSDLESSFRMFVGTRALTDASMVIGAHGAIPANSNIAPIACADVYELAAAGDYAAASRAQELALKYEQLSEVAKGGSANAATISTLKHTLVAWGVIEHPTVTKPLRSLTAEEDTELRCRLETLPRGTQRGAATMAAR